MDETVRDCLLTLGILVVLAGCSAGSLGPPGPQENPVPVKLVNNATVTETFTVGVVALESNLTVTTEDSDQANYTITQGATTIKNSETDEFTRVQFSDSALIHGNYTLEPGEERALSLERVAPNEAIVILIYDDPEQSYRAIHTVSCEGPIRGVRVASKSGGPEDWTTGTHGCGTDWWI